MDHTEFSRLGGKARAKKLTKQQRSDAARAAVNARWEKRRLAIAAASKRKRKKGGAA